MIMIMMIITCIIIHKEKKSSTERCLYVREALKCNFVNFSRYEKACQNNQANYSMFIIVANTFSSSVDWNLISCEHGFCVDEASSLPAVCVLLDLSSPPFEHAMVQGLDILSCVHCDCVCWDSSNGLTHSCRLPHRHNFLTVILLMMLPCLSASFLSPWISVCCNVSVYLFVNKFGLFKRVLFFIQSVFWSYLFFKEHWVNSAVGKCTI